MKIGTITGTTKELEINGTDFTTKKVQILAKTDSGKTYTASKICEELLKEGIPIVIIDPVSAYWGLKEKFSLVIFGDQRNKHADYHLHDDKKTIDNQAELVADYLATNKVSAIIDLKYWVESKQQQFMAAFASRLYVKNQIPRHVFIEEADIFAPQTVQYPDEINSRHYTDNLVRRGRQEGLGCTVISQRPALISKNILTQSDLSIYLNLSGAADLAPARKEIEDDADFTKEQKQQVVSRIKKLPRGEAFFYSPRWLKLKEFVKVGKKETYHAGATRGSSDWRPEAEITLKPVNIEDVKERLLAIAAAEPAKLVQASALSDTKMIERQYNDRLAKKDEEIKLLRQDADEATARAVELNTQLKQLRTEAEIVENLRKLLLSKDIATSENLAVNTENVQLTVVETLKEETWNENSFEGKLAILLSENKWKESLGLSDLHKLLRQHWQIDNNTTRVYPKLKDALALMMRKPYQLVEQDGALWKPTGKPVKKLEVPT